MGKRVAILGGVCYNKRVFSNKGDFFMNLIETLLDGKKKSVILDTDTYNEVG